LVKASGLSIRDVEKRTAVGRSTIDGWKRGKPLPQNRGDLIKFVEQLQAAAQTDFGLGVMFRRSSPGLAADAGEGPVMLAGARARCPARRSSNGQMILTGVTRATDHCSELLLLVELRGFDPLDAKVVAGPAAKLPAVAPTPIASY